MVPAHETLRITGGGRWEDTMLIKKHPVDLSSSLVKFVHLITVSRYTALIYTDMYSVSQRSAICHSTKTFVVEVLMKSHPLLLFPEENPINSS